MNLDEFMSVETGDVKGLEKAWKKFELQHRKTYAVLAIYPGAEEDHMQRALLDLYSEKEKAEERARFEEVAAKKRRLWDKNAALAFVVEERIVL